MTELSREYAEALFALAVEAGEEKTVLKGLKTVLAALRETPEYGELLAAPSIPAAEKIAAVTEAFKGALPEYGVSFLCLLCEKGRTALLEGCVKEYEKLLGERERVATAKVTSAVPLTEEEKAALTEKLSRKRGVAIRLDCTVDPDLLGGVIVETDGVVYDGSLRQKLREIKEVMEK